MIKMIKKNFMSKSIGHSKESKRQEIGESFNDEEKNKPIEVPNFIGRKSKTFNWIQSGNKEDS
eukprot:CAMPEP_0170532096 /NCGR_PEP_ID=MMETSP0209-20121228/68394_1 /TAXON_ID=665100 ORGANISM="Litonotus pictus, Strain P1" /NCGR_SAMPLE_ID=MMETSP0209 /ASSEMBLY_ACC=CAM_ASM_000301 /LENGTH=62 /DNA_ID=CAMNT_0010827711 /DNA_START=102 /DNA_END=286 /DNA_ORIENTATION=-